MIRENITKLIATASTATSIDLAPMAIGRNSRTWQPPRSAVF